MQKVTGSTPVISTRKTLMIRSLLLFMPFLVYIIYSSSLDQYYVGHSENIQDRLFHHNNSGSKSTKKANDWKLVYTEMFQTKSEAAKRELEIKKRKSRKYIEWLSNSAG
jgi:putative endonuclease